MAKKKAPAKKKTAKKKVPRRDYVQNAWAVVKASIDRYPFGS